MEEKVRVAQDVEFISLEPRQEAGIAHEPCRHWMGLMSGLIAISKSVANARPLLLTGVSPGGWFGEAALLKRESPRYEARAIQRAVVARLPRETFDWLLARNISFNHYVMRQINESLWRLLEGQQIGTIVDTDSKVARCLASFFQPSLYPSNGFHLKVTQSELADCCRLSRQRVNAALTKLEGRGWIRVEYGGIRVLDLSGLQQRSTPASRVRHL